MSGAKQDSPEDLARNERLELDAAWEDPVWDVGGYRCHQMTLSDFLSMHRTNAIVSGAESPRPSDLAQFVSILSRTADSPEAVTARLIEARAAGRTAEMWERAAEIVQFAWNQAPRPKRKKGEAASATKLPMTSSTASIIHRLAKEYGWAPAEILARPIAQIWQLNREILIDRHGYDKARAMVITPAESAMLVAGLREAARKARESKP